MVLVDLLQLRPPVPHAASIANGGAPVDPLGGYEVAAMTMMLVADALTPITRWAHRRDADLVIEPGSGAGRDEVATCTLVVGEDGLGAELEESEPAQDVARRRGLLKDPLGDGRDVLEVVGDSSGRWVGG
jgi:hypothetical protein